MKKYFVFIIILLTLSGCVKYANIQTYFSDDDKERYFCREYIEQIKGKFPFSRIERKCINKISTKDTIKLLIEDIDNLRNDLDKARKERLVIEQHLKLECDWIRNFDGYYWPGETCPKTYVCNNAELKKGLIDER